MKRTQGVRKDKKLYNSRLKNRKEKLEFLERFDKLIFNVKMSDRKLEKLKELRWNSCRFTTDQLKEKINKILNDNQ